jgi:D-alanyl-D-alanine carboxypeptidase
VTKNVTARRLALLRRPAAVVAAPALALLLTVTPAHAATATAGATWSQLMNQKLTLDAQAAQLSAQLPTLRAGVTTSTTALAQAQKTQAAAAVTVTTATTADQAVQTRYAAAKTAATKASSAVVAALKRKPLIQSQVLSTKRTRTAANAGVLALAPTVDKAVATVTAAKTAYTTATAQVTAATTAVTTATQAVTTALQKIAALPQQDTTLVAQAAAVSQLVVTQTRAGFTAAQTTTVYGITVNKIIAVPFQRMIDDAAKAGIPLSGGGFRTQAQQIALRTINGCPDIWTAPSSSCRVPTAIPGRSLHEIGLAIDMTSNKKSINDRKSAAFKWLAANAGKYGLTNLPSEPWHWSITGN